MLIVGAGLVPAAASPASMVAGPGPSGPPAVGYSASASGTLLHAAVPAEGTGPGLVAVDVAPSQASAGLPGLATAVVDETGRTAQPAQAPAIRSYGRGAGLELGLLRGASLGFGLGLAGVAEAAAPPRTGLVTRQIGPLALSPLVYASLLRGQAEPGWSDRTCVIGRPLGFGVGSVADVQVLDLGGGPAPSGGFRQALLALNAGNSPDRVVSQSKSVTYLMPNAQGTFSLVSEVRQTIAPVTLLKGLPGEITIELLGEWVLRATASGTPGGAVVEYGPAGDPTPTTPVLRIITGGHVTELSLQQVLGNQGLALSLSPIVELRLGESPRRPAGTTGAVRVAPGPEQLPDGTRAAAAVDVLRLRVLGPLPGGLQVLDVRLGHMEARAQVPAGGVSCPLPVRKTNAPASVRPGEEFTFNISIPAAADALDGLSCDLVGIRAVDTIGGTPADLDFTLGSASRGGAIAGPVVTWNDVGDYHPGDPPITLTVRGRVEPNSVSGVLNDTVVVTAGIDRCTGGATGQALTGVRAAGPGALGGTFTLIGPQVR